MCADGNLTGPLSLFPFLLLLSLSASLFPFDLLLVSFALICGVYGMPLLIPLVAYVESWKLAATILISTSVVTAPAATTGQHAYRARSLRWCLTRRQSLLLCTCAVQLWPV